MSSLHCRRVRPTHIGIRGPLRIESARGLAETSLSRSRAVRRFCFASPQRAISSYVYGSSKNLPQPVSGLDRTTTTRSRSRLRPKRCSTKMSISAHRRCLHSTANSRARAAGLVHRAQPPGGCRGPSRKAVARACSRWAILVARLMVRPQYHSYPSGMSVPVRISNGSTPFNSSAE
jgi:hypothetical protein